MQTEKRADEFSFDIETHNGKKTIAIAYPKVPQENAMKLELRAFIDAITQNKKTEVDEMDGYRSMEVAHQILQKIQRNQPVA